MPFASLTRSAVRLARRWCGTAGDGGCGLPRQKLARSFRPARTSLASVPMSSGSPMES